jgi:hypothetical protein
MQPTLIELQHALSRARSHAAQAAEEGDRDLLDYWASRIDAAAEAIAQRHDAWETPF